MEKIYRHQKTEEEIYRMWEKGGYFTPKINSKKKPFSVILPLPNANDPLHMGHALFTVEDIMARYHRMLGEPTLWLPGSDHAGIETQFVFEKKLAKEGKSRFDFDRVTLYQMISDFVDQNRNINLQQLKRLGFSLDWTRYHYSLEPEIIKKVLATFRKLHEDGLIYRSERIVNFCPQCGTAFSELEVKYKEEQGRLWHIRYPLATTRRVELSKPVGFITVATMRPETMLGDTAVAVHPEDERYKKLVGKSAVLPITNRKIPIIADEAVNPKFGTGAVKITPAHDPLDFEIGQRHDLPAPQVIGFSGRMTEKAGPYGEYEGETVATARERILKDLRLLGLLEKEEAHTHSIGTCYRCGTVIEPQLLPQWFIKIKPLAKPAIRVVKEGKIRIVPQRFEKLYLQWMENIRDWNISRQIVWGPRIPAWYCLDCSPKIVINFIDKEGKKVSGRYKDLEEKYSFREIKRGLQQLTAPKETVYSLDSGSCPGCGSEHTLQETDTFDTWFASGQWPLTTLGYPDSPDFGYFYPTSVLDTLWDILFFWVVRMVMLGLYRAGEIPFRIVHIHSRVVDEKGKKMSKSRGNVINPITMVEKYGADALRMALVIGVAPGSDISIGDNKVRAMRNFANKIWNMGRFIFLNLKGKKEAPFYKKGMKGLTAEDKRIVVDLKRTIRKVSKNLEDFRFGQAATDLYHFSWHRFADQYVEYSKERIKKGDLTVLAVLRHVYLNILKLLHPFMPFVTECAWGKMPRKYKDPLIISHWPKV